MSPKRIILDCDPGIDDAIAILLALGAPAEIALTAITVVAGNVPLAKTERNARRVLALAGRNGVPVSAGCSRPIMSVAGPIAPVHGADGLGNVNFPEPVVELDGQHAVDVLIAAIMESEPGSLTLCPTGPLTNVAMALIKEPQIIERVGDVVLMGGACFRPGNVTATAEFNFYWDPHAAEIVFASGLPITMFPLDVTLQVTATAKRVARLRETGGPVMETAADLLSVYGAGDAALHDPCVVAYLINPDLFSGIAAHVEIECASSAAFGQSITRVRDTHLSDHQPNAKVMTEADADGFFELLTERLATL